MKTRFATASAVLLAALALSTPALAHGAIYNPDPGKPTAPPGTTNPSDPGPTGGGGTGGDTGHGGVPSGGPAHRPPAPSGPATGGPQGPRSVPTGTSPAPSPAGPQGPATGGPQAPAAVPTEVQGAIELASWEDWWHFNKDPYLDVRRAVLSSLPATGNDELARADAFPGRPTREMLELHVAPGLRKLLLEERANDIVTGALVALARIGEPDSTVVNAASTATPPEPSVALLLSRSLADANQEVAETAALALGILRAEAAIPDLEALVRDDGHGRALLGGRAVPTRTRAFAAIGLGLTAERASTNRARQVVARALTAVLDDDRTSSPDVQVAAVLGLALDPIDVEEVESTSAAWVSRQTVVRRLMHVFSDDRRHRMLRAHAAAALARLAQDAPAPLRIAVQELLLDALRPGTRLENEVVQSCVQALGVLGGRDDEKLARETRSALVRELDRPDHATRCFALVALAEQGGRASLHAGDAGDPGAAENEEACRSAIVNEIVRGKRSMRPWAVLALGVLERRLADRQAPPSASARELLRGTLANARQRDEIGSAAIALGLARDPQAEALLRAKLAETNEDTGQGFVALALGMVGAGDAIPALRAIVRESKYRPDVLEQSACALALLGDSSVGPDLAAAFAQAPGQAAQAALARAIGAIGDRRCVDPLLRLAAGGEGRAGTAAARGFAAAALGKVADGDLLPWYSKIACDLDYRASPAFLMSGDGTGLLEIL